jgi:hypothetical protein
MVALAVVLASARPAFSQSPVSVSEGPDALIIQAKDYAELTHHFLQ